MHHLSKVWKRVRCSFKCLTSSPRMQHQHTHTTFTDDSAVDTPTPKHGFYSEADENPNSVKGLTDTWILGDFIAEGAFGVVRHARGLKSNTEAVIKTVVPNRILTEYLVKKEALVLMNLPPRSNFPRLLDFIEKSNTVSIVMTKMTGHELGAFVCGEEETDSKVSESDAKLIIKQLLECIMMCHACGILHRDIKLDNVLWDSDSKHLSLIDFGASSFIYHANTFLRDAVGCMVYASPGLLGLVNDGIPFRAGQGHADLWAIGVLTYAILTGFFPFRGEEASVLAQEISTTTDGDLIVDAISPEGNHFIQTLLHPDNEMVISASGMLKHSWFDTTKGESIQFQEPYSLMDFTPTLHTSPLKLNQALKEVEIELEKGLRMFKRTCSGSSLQSQRTLCDERIYSL